jgi:propionyl-CoA carboxylase alpha chain
MGIATVAVFAAPDRGAPFVTLADEAVPLGAADSYRNLEAILDAAERTGADAVHPGYGFLAERAELADGCRKRGLTFVGPPPEVLAALGDKLEAKRVAAAAGVPVLPGEAVAGPAGDAGERVGFPLVVKATHGGGGIGMRVVRDPADLAEAVEAARRQAGGAFGDDEVFLERWLEAPRHVEIQLLADAAGRMVHLSERECSIQRRHQKLIEESPSPAVGPALRERLGDAALAVARAVGYVGAGTVEFLLEGSGEPRGGAPVDRDGGGEAFWFLEVNARIQVEHPVTEAVTGLDLVRLQLLIAAGEPLGPELSRIGLRGHAIEGRLYAEDPANRFLPQAGTLHRFQVGPEAAQGADPGGWGVRVDAGVADGSVVGVHYDPLLAKVVAHAPTRPEAARLLASTLATARLHGIVTNRDLLVGALRSEAFGSGETDTAFLDRHPPAALTAAGGAADPMADRLHAAVAALAAQAERRATATVHPAVPSGWRNNPSQLQQVDLQPVPASGPGATVSVAYRFDRAGSLDSLEVDGDPLAGSRLWRCSRAERVAATWLLDLEVDGVLRRFEAHRVGATWFVDSPLGRTELREPQDEGLWTTGSSTSGDRLRSPTGGPRRPDQDRRSDGGLDLGRSGLGRGPGAGPGGSVAPSGATDGVTVSPLPGIVRRVAVRVGDRVEAGAVLVVVEAMKTEHRIAATRAGTVRRVLVAEEQEVAAGATVVEFEEAADG